MKRRWLTIWLICRVNLLHCNTGERGGKARRKLSIQRRGALIEEEPSQANKPSSSMNFKRRRHIGFSLMETVAGMLVLVLSVVGSFEALRLSDLKVRHSQIDNRITELLRENSDYLMYVAYDLLPTDGA